MADKIAEFKRKLRAKTKSQRNPLSAKQNVLVKQIQKYRLERNKEDTIAATSPLKDKTNDQRKPSAESSVAEKSSKIDSKIKR